MIATDSEMTSIAIFALVGAKSHESALMMPQTGAPGLHCKLSLPHHQELALCAEVKCKLLLPSSMPHAHTI